MATETPFSFDYAFPGKKHWRGGPEKLASFQDELIQYKIGLETLSRILSMCNFSKWIIIGYSAANMVADMKTVSVGLPSSPQVNIFGRDG